jgi:hypothetical protein
MSLFRTNNVATFDVRSKIINKAMRSLDKMKTERDLDLATSYINKILCSDKLTDDDELAILSFYKNKSKEIMSNVRFEAN